MNLFNQCFFFCLLNISIENNALKQNFIQFQTLKDSRGKVFVIFLFIFFKLTNYINFFFSFIRSIDFNHQFFIINLVFNGIEKNRIFNKFSIPNHLNVC
jgi:hypothetical protein